MIETTVPAPPPKRQPSQQKRDTTNARPDRTAWKARVLVLWDENQKALALVDPRTGKCRSTQSGTDKLTIPMLAARFGKQPHAIWRFIQSQRPETR